MTESEKLAFVQRAMVELFDYTATGPLTPDMKLLDLGVDSLGAVELQLYYEDTMHTELPDSTTAVMTVGDLIALMP